MSQQLEIISAAMREYGEAVRGDWSEFDGRSERHVLDSFADAIEGVGYAAGFTLEEWRANLGICLSGGGHWKSYCNDGWNDCSE